MKKVLKILVLILLVSCSSINTNYYKLIKGNWSSCLKDGTYIEFYFNDSSLDIYRNDLWPNFGGPLPYEIINDTLILYLNKRDEYFDFYKMKKLNKNEIILTHQIDTISNQAETITLIRILNEIPQPPKFDSLEIQILWYDSVYIPLYNERMLNKNCRDSRTPKEKLEDKRKIHKMDNL